MKNKFVILLLCAALTGCGQTASTGSSVISGSDTASSFIISDVPESAFSDDIITDDNTQPDKAKVEAKTIYEDDQIAVRAESLDSDTDSTYLEVTIENKLDKNITLSCSEAYVNNYLIDTAFSAEIAAKDSLLTGIDFTNSLLNTCGITNVTDISLRLCAYSFDSADQLYETDLMDITTDQSGTEQPVDTTGEIVFENSGITVIKKGMSHDSDGNPKAVFLITNRADKAMFIDAELTGTSADSAYIDCGYMLASGKQALVYVRAIDTKGNIMSSLDGLTYHFLLSDGETWDDIATSDEMTF